MYCKITELNVCKYNHKNTCIYDSKDPAHCEHVSLSKPNILRSQQSEGQVERVVMSRLITHIYNCGYIAGHNDTVESCFTDIFSQDMDTYQEDIVEELLDELQEG